MRFVPYGYAKDSVRLPVVVKSMTAADAQRTNQPPLWQTSWTSDYLSDDRLEKYAVQLDDELIGLGAYEINDDSLIVHIVYMEAQPESNPTIVGKERKYRGIGRLLIAYGIKLAGMLYWKQRRRSLRGTMRKTTVRSVFRRSALLRLGF